jgi:hypothetical protein
LKYSVPDWVETTSQEWFGPFECAGYMKTGPPPPVPFVHSLDFDENVDFGPALGTSTIPGIMKYYHHQSTMLPHEHVELDRRMKAYWLPWLVSRPWDHDQAYQQLNEKKASGLPFSKKFGSSKGEVLQKWTDFDLVLYFMLYSLLKKATLKVNELRVNGKAARTFIFSCISSVYVGNLLFGGMQEQFVQGLFHHAGFIGASIPGADMMRMWGEFAKLLNKNWKMHCTDGASWDANLSLDILHVVRDLLEAATPILWRRKMIRRYFDQTFVGWVVADGHIVRTFGMTSGCTLTSLGNIGPTRCFDIAFHTSWLDSR